MPTLSTADPALAAGLDRAWQQLVTAVADRAAPFRTPVVATAGDGPDARVMVLRAVDPDAARLIFFTDARAAKVAAVAADDRVAILAWDAGAQLQLRLRGTARVVVGPAADRHWRDVPAPSRRNYASAEPPGASGTAVMPAAAGDGRANFALLEVVVDSVEWLDLAGLHRRARYHRAGGDWHGTWLVP